MMNDNVEVRSLAESLRRRMEAFVETGAVVRLQASFRGSRARRRIVSGVRRGFEKLCRELEDPYWKGGTDTSGATLMLMLHPIAGNKVSWKCADYLCAPTFSIPREKKAERKIGQPEPVPTVVTADAKQEKASTSTCISRKDSVESVSSPALVDVAGAVPTDFSSLVEGKSLSELAAELAWTRKLLRQRLQILSERQRE